MSAEIVAFIQEAEAKVLRRLVQLTEAENPRIALRACEVVLRYMRDLRREEAQAPPAKTDPKPPAAPKVKVPEALVRPPTRKPAFCAVPLDKFAALADLSAPRPAPTG